MALFIEILRDTLYVVTGLVFGSGLSARTIVVEVNDMGEAALNLLGWLLEIWVWVFDLDAPFSFE